MEKIFGGESLDEVKRNAVAITNEVRQLETTYENLYYPIADLSENYRIHKGEVFFFRYGSLKEMIKLCINMHNERMQAYEIETKPKPRATGLLDAARAFRDTARKLNEITEAYENEKKPKPRATGLSDTARAFGDTAGKLNEIMEELERLKKAELLRHIKDMEKESGKLQRKIQFLESLIKRLHSDYTVSKQRNPITRYRLMKQMAKTLFRRDDIKPNKDKRRHSIR